MMSSATLRAFCPFYYFRRVLYLLTSSPFSMCRLASYWYRKLVALPHRVLVVYRANNYAYFTHCNQAHLHVKSILSRKLTEAGHAIDKLIRGDHCVSDHNSLLVPRLSGNAVSIGTVIQKRRLLSLAELCHDASNPARIVRVRSSSYPVLLSKAFSHMYILMRHMIPRRH